MIVGAATGVVNVPNSFFTTVAEDISKTNKTNQSRRHPTQSKTSARQFLRNKSRVIHEMKSSTSSGVGSVSQQVFSPIS